MTSRYFSFLLPLLFVVSCGQETPVVKKSSSVDLYSQLPPSPVFDRSAFAPYPDGSYSVKAAFYNKSVLFNKDIKLQGYVQSIKLCPESFKKSCIMNHVVVVDKNEPTIDPEDLMIVTDFKTTKGIVPGKKYLFTGQFATTSPDGFSSSRGLLISASSKNISAEPVQ